MDKFTRNPPALAVGRFKEQIELGEAQDAENTTEGTAANRARDRIRRGPTQKRISQ